TGETSNPTMAVTGDTAGIFFALEEVDLVSVTKTPAAGELILTFGSRVPLRGILDLATSAPTVLVAGSTIQAITAGITISGVPPPLGFRLILPAAAALTLSGAAPLFPIPGDTKTGQLSLTGLAAVLQTSGGANVTVTPNTGVLRLQRVVEFTP